MPIKQSVRLIYEIAAVARWSHAGLVLDFRELVLEGDLSGMLAVLQGVP